MAINSTDGSERTSLTISILPIMAAVFIAFLVIGLALPVLPLHVHDDLRLGGFVVGLIAGAQFAASLISRVWAGRFADTRGGKLAVILGLIGSALSGLLYLVSIPFQDSPILSASILLAGRAVLGGAESFIITGAVSWGLMIGGPNNAGKVIAWIGTAMYAAFAVGAPLGGTLFEAYGFMSIALMTALVPLVTLVAVLPQKGILPPTREAAPMMSVLAAIWLPGVGLAMSSLGFGAMMTFASLLFSERGWTPVWLGVTAFAASFIVARLLLGHIADKLGGARVALVCLVIEAVGLGLIWFATNETVAFLGAILTGFGYSLVYPGFGVEAVRRAPAKARGMAMGTYTAFLDLSLGLSSPALGMLAARGGMGKVFLVSSVVVAAASLVAMRLQVRLPAEDLS